MSHHLDNICKFQFNVTIQIAKPIKQTSAIIVMFLNLPSWSFQL